MHFSSMRIKTNPPSCKLCWHITLITWHSPSPTPPPPPSILWTIWSMPNSLFDMSSDSTRAHYFIICCQIYSTLTRQNKSFLYVLINLPSMSTQYDAYRGRYFVQHSMNYAIISWNTCLAFPKCRSKCCGSAIYIPLCPTPLDRHIAIAITVSIIRYIIIYFGGGIIYMYRLYDGFFHHSGWLYFITLNSGSPVLKQTSCAW